MTLVARPQHLKPCGAPCWNWPKGAAATADPIVRSSTGSQSVDQILWTPAHRCGRSRTHPDGKIALNQRVLGSSPSASTTFSPFFNALQRSQSLADAGMRVLGSSLGSSTRTHHRAWSSATLWRFRSRHADERGGRQVLSESWPDLPTIATANSTFLHTSCWLRRCVGAARALELRSRSPYRRCRRSYAGCRASSDMPGGR